MSYREHLWTWYLMSQQISGRSKHIVVVQYHAVRMRRCISIVPSYPGRAGSFSCDCCIIIKWSPSVSQRFPLSLRARPLRSTSTSDATTTSKPRVRSGLSHGLFKMVHRRRSNVKTRAGCFYCKYEARIRIQTRSTSIADLGSLNKQKATN